MEAEQKNRIKVLDPFSWNTHSKLDFFLTPHAASVLVTPPNMDHNSTLVSPFMTPTPFQELHCSVVQSTADFKLTVFFQGHPQPSTSLISTSPPRSLSLS